MSHDAPAGRLARVMSPAQLLLLATLLLAAGAAGAVLHVTGELDAVLRFLRPWELSRLVVTATLLAAGLYTIGLLRGPGEGVWKPLAFFVGLGLAYFVMHTRYDYLAQGMFWVHRLQHLVLHHLAPLLIVLARPQPVMMRAVPRLLRERVLEPVSRHPLIEGPYRFIQHPAIAAILFVGLIYLWLWPEMHWDAMLSSWLYQVMNWSMLIDGLLFWWVMLDSRPTHRTRPSYGVRIIILWLIMIPQIMLGAYIGLSNRDLYEVYDVCGRVWAIDPMLDQRIGGLITWIPSSMMSVIVALVIISMWMKDRRSFKG